MYVPNYIPEPLEVPGNITTQPYRARVKFIRRVVVLHSIGWLGVAALSLGPGKNLSTRWLGLEFVAILILLDLLRIRLRGRASEAKLSSLFLPIVLLLSGCTAGDLARHGWPSWSVLCGVGAVLVYTGACGRDFSFVGCFFFSWVLSSFAIFGTSRVESFSTEVFGRAMLLNFLYLVYYVYDLASLLARRRENEALGAVVDLYRDVFNFIGYFTRCLHHWKKHKIWVTSNKPAV